MSEQIQTQLPSKSKRVRRPVDRVIDELGLIPEEYYGVLVIDDDMAVIERYRRVCGAEY